MVALTFECAKCGRQGLFEKGAGETSAGRQLCRTCLAESDRERDCWVCREAQAKTGEHKWPRSYLDRQDWQWKDMQHGTWAGEVFHTQGSGSKNLKNFVLCFDCNNARTSPADKALKAFLLWAEENPRAFFEGDVDLSVALEGHDALDLYRALLKLEFSRLYDHGVSVDAAIADFVMGGQNWEAANELVRIEFRLAPMRLPLGLSIPHETDSVWYANPYLVSHQINFGWLGIHYLYAPEDRPAAAWAEWQFGRIPLSVDLSPIGPMPQM